MAFKQETKRQKYINIVYVCLAAILLIAIFASMVTRFFELAEDEAYKNLNNQATRIEEELAQQLVSDRSNLSTMANFAAKLYSDGDDFSLMFDSFRPVGLIKNIGILMPDNSFITKVDTINLDGLISFEDEALRCEYTSGRVNDLTVDNLEIIRSAVPIIVEGETVGILYGVTSLKEIDSIYSKMASDIEAQLFVFDSNGNLIIDTISDGFGNISFLKERVYSEGCSYEDIIENDSGYSSFESAYKDEKLYLHYSAIEQIGWKLILGRYESQVFSTVHTVSKIIINALILMMIIVVACMISFLSSIRKNGLIYKTTSRVRRLLLEINSHKNNLTYALKEIYNFTGSSMAIYFDNDGECVDYTSSQNVDGNFLDDSNCIFINTLFRYTQNTFSGNKATVNRFRIIKNKSLQKSEPKFYDFLEKYGVSKIIFSSVTDENNHVSVLAVTNPKKEYFARNLLEDTAICFSIAIYNKRHLKKTELEATTDSLTGISNRVTYKKDVSMFDRLKPESFACLYIDVNELHIRNNKFGHAYGDEMLLYIAKSLTKIFQGQNVYRVGGDEFLVFVQGFKKEEVKDKISILKDHLDAKDYHIAIGMSYRDKNVSTEEMVKEAEVKMYQAKAKFYLEKEDSKADEETDETRILQMNTGIAEIDGLLGALKDRYNGIYNVNLETNKAHRILMPAYLGYKENEDDFSGLMTKYVEDAVPPEFHRVITSFLNYDFIRKQLSNGRTPKIKYKKNNGEDVSLCVYNLSDSKDNIKDTLWVFAKE